MALDPKFEFSASKDGLAIVMQDLTGIFNATSNEGGWGAPNPLVANVTLAKLDILIPGATQTVAFSMRPILPSEKFEYVILRSQNLGLGTDILLPDGTYCIDITITESGGPTTYEIHTEITLKAQKGACVNRMLARVAETGCDCDRQFIVDATEAFVVLKAMEYAAISQRTTTVTKVEELLDRYCQILDCSSCD